jgi:hypothetical protein
MAQLSDTLANKFPEITDAKWNRWGLWYALLMGIFFPRTWEEKVLVILDSDGEVHLRLWSTDLHQQYFSDNLGEGQYVFAVGAISGKVEPVYRQRVYNWIYQMFVGPLDHPQIAPVMKITKEYFALTFKEHRSTMSWKDLGRLYKLGLTLENGVLRGRIFQSMSEIVLGKGADVLVDSMLELWESADAREAHMQKALNLEQTERALVGNRAVVQALLSLVEDLEAMPDAASEVARKTRQRTLQHLVYVAAREPQYFERILMETTAKLEQL